MNIPSREASFGHGCARPHHTTYSAKFQRFIARQTYARPAASDGEAWSSSIQRLARHLQTQPIPGLAKLLDFQTRGDAASAVFELLPGHSLERIVKETGGLAGSAWCEFAQQLLDLCEQVHDRDGIEIHLDPRALYLWQNEGAQPSIACATCEFSGASAPEANLWVHTLRALAVVWYYMATGSWESYHQLTKRDLKEVPQLDDQPEIFEFFELLFHEDVEQRVFDRQQIRALLDACEHQLAHQPFPVSLLRRLNSLPSQRRCFDWLPSERDLPSQYCISATGRDARRPTILPAIDEIANRPVSLHLLPPHKSIDKRLRQLCLQAERWMRNPDEDLPIFPLRDQWKTGDCTTFVESIPNGLSLAQVLSLSGGGLRSPIVLEVLRKVNQALRQVERKGYEIPSIDPMSVFVVAADGKRIDTTQLDWLEEPSRFAVRLRILPTRFLHGNDPATYGADGKSRTIREIVGLPPKTEFAELAARLLCRRELAFDNVKHALHRASAAKQRTSAFLRTKLLSDLQRAILKPHTNPTPALRASQNLATWWNTALFPLQRAALGTAAALSLIAVASLISVLYRTQTTSEPRLVGNSHHDVYLGSKASDHPPVEPPANLTPVIGRKTSTVETTPR